MIEALIYHVLIFKRILQIKQFVIFILHHEKHVYKTDNMERLIAKAFDRSLCLTSSCLRTADKDNECDKIDATE